MTYNNNKCRTNQYPKCSIQIERRPPLTISSIQARISPPILVVPIGNSLLPQTLGPKLTIPTSSNWFRFLSATLTRGPPESPTQGALPGTPVETQSIDLGRSLSSKHINGVFLTCHLTSSISWNTPQTQPLQHQRTVKRQRVFCSSFECSPSQR